jgi:hypothetical protein
MHIGLKEDFAFLEHEIFLINLLQAQMTTRFIQGWGSKKECLIKKLLKRIILDFPSI